MLGFMDTVLAENFNLADNPATTALRCLVIAETSIHIADTYEAIFARVLCRTCDFKQYNKFEVGFIENY